MRLYVCFTYANLTIIVSNLNFTQYCQGFESPSFDVLTLLKGRKGSGRLRCISHSLISSYSYILSLHVPCVKTEWISHSGVFSSPAAYFCPAWLPITPLPITLSRRGLLMGPWSVALVPVSGVPFSVDTLTNSSCAIPAS